MIHDSAGLSYHSPSDIYTTRPKLWIQNFISITLRDTYLNELNLACSWLVLVNSRTTTFFLLMNSINSFSPSSLRILYTKKSLPGGGEAFKPAPTSPFPTMGYLQPLICLDCFCGCTLTLAFCWSVFLCTLFNSFICLLFSYDGNWEVSFWFIPLPRTSLGTVKYDMFKGVILYITLKVSVNLNNVFLLFLNYKMGFS